MNEQDYIYSDNQQKPEPTIIEGNTETVSTIDRLYGQATRGMAQTTGHSILTAVVLLSGLLSALFFWRFSQAVFTGVHPVIALVLGLVVGLLPAEGAFLGWKSIRATKANMTKQQLTATQFGLLFAVFCSVFGTFSLFVATVPFVPAEITAYANWLVFAAMSMPVIGQMCIIAYYEINERGVVENFENAKLSALGFDSYIKFETARKQAVINSANAYLDRVIGTHADERGADEIERLLRGNSSGSIGEQPQQPPTLPQQQPAAQPRPQAHTNGNGQRVNFE